MRHMHCPSTTRKTPSSVYPHSGAVDTFRLTTRSSKHVGRCISIGSQSYMSPQVNLPPPRRLGLASGLLSILAIVFLQAINSFGCYGHSFVSFLKALTFIAVPMLPALVCLIAKRPARAVGASVFFGPWLLFAFYTDCIRAGVGTGASMVYVSIVLLGFPSALLGAVFGPTLWRIFRRGVS